MPLLLMIRQNAQLEIVHQNGLAIVIRDRSDRGGPTVTNDAAGVVERLEPILGGRRLFYFDSEGELSELRVQNGKFAGFAALQFQGGVCRHCGCSDADPCRFGRYRTCSWIDPLHTVCSNASCVQAEIDSLFELIEKRAEVPL